MSDLKQRVAKLETDRTKVKASTPVIPTVSAERGWIELDDSVDVQASTTSAVGWTTFDASAYVPENATVVLLECEFGQTSASTDAKIWARRDSGSIERLIARDSVGTEGVHGSCSQVQVPLTSGLTFDYMIENGFGDGAEIRMTDYFVP